VESLLAVLHLRLLNILLLVAGLAVGMTTALAAAGREDLEPPLHIQ
jgi:hypothetical protein